jgi:cytochrome c-type biogenesis protein CcmH/NrfG
MKKNTSKTVSTMTTPTAVSIALVAFIFGFCAGVGLTVFKMKDSPRNASNPTSEINYEHKEKVLKREVMNNPQNTAAWIQLGHVYFDTDKYAQAIEAYQKALELNPDNADVLTDLGIMFRRSGKPSIAIEKFDQAIAVDPKHEASRFNKGIVLLHDIGDRDNALKTWEELLDINPLVMIDENQSLDQMVKHYTEGHDKN